MNKIVGLDIDDVCLELVRRWLFLYNIKFKDTLLKEHIKNWDIGSYTKDQKAFYEMLNDEVYAQIEAVDGALEGVYRLRKKYRVVFITSNFGEVGVAKHKSMNRLGFDVSKKDYVEASDKSLVISHVLVDDNSSNVVQAYGHGILYNQPWNEGFKYAPRVRNWDELIQTVERMLNESTKR